MEKEIIPSITTLKNDPSKWEEIYEDCEKYQIKKMALFLTGYDREQRSECYKLAHQLLLRYQITVPFVHARHDMASDEYHLLMDSFGAEMFNLHPLNQIPLHQKLETELLKYIYIENSRELSKKDVEDFAGVCLDLSHLEDSREFWDEKEFLKIIDVLNHSKIGCNHISAFAETPKTDETGAKYCSRHTLTNLNELRYLSDYSSDYFGKYIAIELNNRLSDQMEAIDYIKSVVRI